MFIRTLARWLHDRLKYFAKRFETISDERELTEEVERLDREQPGWDFDGRVAGCSAALQEGMDRASAVGIYGEDVVTKAEHNIANDTQNP